jgi:anaerobic selenocysteine-containing dehydrogenase
LRPFAWGLGAARDPLASAAARALVRNRDALPWSADVLRWGACDLCGLGAHGLRDGALAGTHLCSRRFDALADWTRAPVDPRALPDLAALHGLDPAGLRRLGRLGAPLFRRRGDAGFRVLSWDDAINLAASRLAASDGRWGMLLDPDGLSNEGLFAFQKAARALGSPHVDTLATEADEALLGALEGLCGTPAGTCGWEDLLGTDLVLLFCVRPSEQPLLARYLALAREGGTRVVCITAEDLPEDRGVLLPALPGAPAPFAVRLFDERLRPAAGGETALALDLARRLIEADAGDSAWLARRVAAPDALDRELRALDPSRLAAAHAIPATQVRMIARVLGVARSGVVILGPGSGASAALLLPVLRGWFGRRHCGVLPLPGSPGLQAARDLGVGGARPPASLAWPRARILAEADSGVIEALCFAGDSARRRDAPMPETPFRVHVARWLDPGIADPAGDEVLVLPMRVRHEQRGGTTATAADRTLRFSPEVRGREPGDARSDWEIPAAIARRAAPLLRADFDWVDAVAVRQLIAREVPRYAGIERLHAPGDRFQWGGARLHERGFASPDGRCRPVLPLPERAYSRSSE